MSLEELRRPRRFTESLLERLDEMVYTCGSDGSVTYFNNALRDLLRLEEREYRLADLERRRCVYLADGRELSPEEGVMRRVLRGETVNDLELVVRIGEDVRAVTANGLQYLDDRGRLAGMVVLHDVTAQRRAEAERDFGASHDSLTGLPNRVGFVSSVAAALERSAAAGTATAILEIDIDKFRAVAAVLGYERSQPVLREIATRIESVLRSVGRQRERSQPDGASLLRLVHPGDPRSSDITSMARVGSDEFLVLCEEVEGEDGVLAVVARIRDALAPPIPAGGSQVAVTASVGITMCTDPHADPNRLISQAEVAMHRARRLGPGNHAFFVLGVTDDEARRAADVEELETAIRDGQLMLLYQPKVSLPDERMVGVEALVRWEHPQRGIVSPLDFIPLAEETGLVVPLGAWVLEEACRQAETWRRRHPHLPALTMSVNVSARQLDADLPRTVAAALQSSGLEPSSLYVEVTESAVMRDVRAAVAALDAIKAMGVRISVDDFGTGYSSLAYLKRLPADELKVDKSFVDGLGTDPDDTAIVAAVVASAHALGLCVVAEGVETAENVTSLVTLGCELAQGFHYSRPVPADAVDSMLGAGGRFSGHAAADGSAGSRTAERVLIVDDAADVRQLAHMSLAAFGFEVHEAEDGRTALEMARAIQPDCVVLDLNLPDMAGSAVCRALRHDPATRGCTVVMLTAEGSAGEKVEAFSMGADEYIVKPFSPRDLATRIRAAMRHRQAQRVHATARGA
jgi:predicted signal transduction protein with EAL and GGDEF domain/ActR/RegA family two-component response regulator